MCETCAHCRQKLTFLGFRDWCKLYKKYVSIKCIDWTPR